MLFKQVVVILETLQARRRAYHGTTNMNSDKLNSTTTYDSWVTFKDVVWSV